jgi:energy-coupling factor transport system permease protein
MAQSLYVDKDRFLQGVNPVSKLALVFAISTAAFVFGDPRFIAVPLLFALGATLYSGGARNVRRIGVVLVSLFVFGLVIWSLYADPSGPVIVSLGPLTITSGQAVFALGRSERIATFLLAGIMYITTTSNEEIVQGLRRIGLPYSFCFAIGTALRLFPTFLDATQTVKQAQEARGQDFDEGWFIQRVRNYVPLVIPVLITAIQNVDAQSMALETRGFDPGSERSFFRRETFDARDWAVAVFSVVVGGGAIALRLMGVGTV